MSDSFTHDNGDISLYTYYNDTAVNLGDKVKVTILATGFGIEDVDGMSSHFTKRTQEEADRIAAEEEKAAERQDRRNRYYGKDGSSSQYKRHPHIFIFRQEDLDNDDVISDVEQIPTYKRTRQILEEIRSKAAGNIKKTDNENKEPIQGTIKF